MQSRQVDSGVLRERYRPLAERLRGSAPVVDVNPGRGEFLDVMRELDVEAEGVDPRAEVIEGLGRKNLRSTRFEVEAFLSRHPGRFGGVYARRALENLDPAAAQRLVAAAATALRAGGVLIVVAATPNNLLTQLDGRWRETDPGRLYSPDLVRELFRLAGLREMTVFELPGSRLEPPGLSDTLAPSLAKPGPPDRWLGRVREWATRKLQPHSTALRLSALEDRINRVDDWVLSLYPGAEYVVTGVR